LVRFVENAASSRRESSVQALALDRSEEIFAQIVVAVKCFARSAGAVLSVAFRHNCANRIGVIGASAVAADWLLAGSVALEHEIDRVGVPAASR
jgi:hypothetical protein